MVVAFISAGTANNAGAILVLGRDLVVVPKLIHPLPPVISSPETSPEHLIEDTWMQVLQLFSIFQFHLLDPIVDWRLINLCFSLFEIRS